MNGAARTRQQAFTLVELLVVVSITALLIAMLLPSLRKAREAGKYTACGSNLRQIGMGMHCYAADHQGLVPRGPEPAGAFDFTGNDLATNQLWIGEGEPATPTAHPRQFNGLGSLMATTAPEPKLYFCPADDNRNRQEELPRIGTAEDAYGSYLYRQLDHLPPGAATGRLDSLGANEIGERTVPVEALALDTNSLGPEELGMRHTNHHGRAVNILFRDASVRRFRNPDHLFAIGPEQFAELAGIPLAIDQLLTNADFAYRSRPKDAPQIETSTAD